MVEGVSNPDCLTPLSLTLHPCHPSTLAHICLISSAGISPPGSQIPQHPASLPAALSPAPPVTSIASLHSFLGPGHSELHTWARLGLQRPLYHPAVCSPLCSVLGIQSAPTHWGPWDPPLLGIPHPLPALTHLLAPFWETLLCPPLHSSVPSFLLSFSHHTLLSLGTSCHLFWPRSLF